MIYTYKFSKKQKAGEKLTGSCPLCHKPVFSMNTNGIHQWSHLGVVSCDPWGESETEWNIRWKEKFRIENIDECVSDENESHLIDIQTLSGVRIKMAHVVKVPRNMNVIENFFGEKMAWLVDAEGGQIHVPKWSKSKRPLFFDFGNDTILYYASGESLGVEGLAISYERFLRKYRGGL